MKKVDLLKELGGLYNPPKDRPVIVEVPRLKALAVDGQGDPNVSTEYRDAIQALYSVSYTMKFAVKKRDGIDYRVMPLEGLWWADDTSSFTEGRKGEWKWTAMMVQPEFITRDLVEEALSKLKGKGLPGLGKVRLEAFEEGTSAQMLYIGPFADEGPAIAKLHAFIAGSGRVQRGKHHEIYMSDIRKVDPSRLKTIIRQPVG